MHLPLISNIDTLKDRIDPSTNKKMQSKQNEISVSVKTSDLFAGVENPIFYASRYGMLYNPHDEFSPSVSGNHAIKGQLVDDYWEMLPKAREEYKRLLSIVKAPNVHNSDEIEELKRAVEQKQARITEQSNLIAELKERANSAKVNNSPQTDRLEALCELQAKAIEQLKELRPRTIIIKNGESTNSYEPKEVLHEKFEKIVKLVAKGHPVFLAGPAGTGKSKLAEQVAEALGLKFYSESAMFQEFKLTGFRDMKGDYNETAFYMAFKNGGLFMIDEIDASAPEVLVTINTAIAQGYFMFEGEFVRAHKDFRIISAGNTVGTGADAQYVGRQQLDASTLDRFFIIKIDYDINIEREIALGDTDLVEFARNIREKAEELGINILFSYRSIGRIASMQDEFDLVELLDIALLKGMAKDDVRQLTRNLNLPSSNKYLKALKAS